MQNETQSATEQSAITASDAKTALSGLKTRLEEAVTDLAAATENLDDAAKTIAQTSLDSVLAEAAALVVAFTSETLSARRLKMMINAAADLTPAQLKSIAEAHRVSSTDGIALPPGRFENCSRGKGWCRQGNGSDATWGERVSGGYKVCSEGKWIVGSNDGFSRKDSVSWTVQKIGNFWIAN